MAEPSIPPGFDFTDPDLNAIRVPAEELSELRRTAPVWWNAQPHGASGFDDDGYWVVTKHADVLEVSRASDLYSSQEKTAIIRHGQPVHVQVGIGEVEARGDARLGHAASRYNAF